MNIIYKIKNIYSELNFKILTIVKWINMLRERGEHVYIKEESECAFLSLTLLICQQTNDC